MARRRKLTRSQRMKKADRAMKGEHDDKIASRMLVDILKEKEDNVLDTSDLGQSIKFYALKNKIDPLTGEKINSKKKRRR